MWLLNGIHGPRAPMTILLIGCVGKAWSVPSTSSTVNSWNSRNHWGGQLALEQAAHKVSAASDVREDGRGHCLVIVRAEAINEIVVVQHIDPADVSYHGTSALTLEWSSWRGQTRRGGNAERSG